jgi:tetratricopeptide (TPR) repeat protein
MENTLTSGSVYRRAFYERFILLVALSVAVGCTFGCGRSTGPVTDAEAERETNYQRAKSFYEQRDFPAAAESYKRALSVNPEFARAHLELGLLCDDKLGDPISAIYHYRTYLELQPDSDKKQLVQDFIERAKLSLAAKLPQSPIIDPSELTRLQNEKATLLQENALLRTRVAELEKAVGGTTVATASPSASADTAPTQVVSTSSPTTIMAAPPMSATADGSGTEPSHARIHVVQKGDTLYSLALRYYGTRAGWEKIFQANRSGLPSRDQLKVGQQLVIP